MAKRAGYQVVGLPNYVVWVCFLLLSYDIGNQLTMIYSTSIQKKSPAMPDNAKKLELCSFPPVVLPLPNVCVYIPQVPDMVVSGHTRKHILDKWSCGHARIMNPFVRLLPSRILNVHLSVRSEGQHPKFSHYPFSQPRECNINSVQRPSAISQGRELRTAKCSVGGLKKCSGCLGRASVRWP